MDELIRTQPPSSDEGAEARGGLVTCRRPLWPQAAARPHLAHTGGPVLGGCFELVPLLPFSDDLEPGLLSSLYFPSLYVPLNVIMFQDA